MELFYDFNGFQLLFPALFWLFGKMNLHTNLDLTLFGRGLGCCLGNFCGFSYFFLLFSGFLAEFGVLFCGFLRFQLLFSGFFGGFGALFGEFLRFQLHKARLLCYQPMAIVHYDNLKIQYFLNKKTKKVNFQKK